jgi:hypothetical protein
VLITELEQPGAALPTEASLERAWLIVNAGVYDSAVAAGLMEAQGALLLEKGNA